MRHTMLCAFPSTCTCKYADYMFSEAPAPFPHTLFSFYPNLFSVHVPETQFLLPDLSIITYSYFTSYSFQRGLFLPARGLELPFLPWQFQRIPGSSITAYLPLLPQGLILYSYSCSQCPQCSSNTSAVTFPAFTFLSQTS